MLRRGRSGRRTSTLYSLRHAALSRASSPLAFRALIARRHPARCCRATSLYWTAHAAAAIRIKTLPPQSSAMSGRGRRPDVEAGCRLAPPGPFLGPSEAGTVVAASWTVLRGCRLPRSRAGR
jgi:hypothetical protein